MRRPARPSRSAPRLVRRGGFTLVEATISVVIVGLMLVAALDVLGTTARARRIRAERDDGFALAHDLVVEILATRFEEPDDAPIFGRESGESGTSRAAWDDVDDYDGWSASPPLDRSDVPVPGGTGWTRAVAVVEVEPGTLVERAPGSGTGLKKVTVTVTGPTGADTTVSALRGRHGANEQPPPADTTFVTGVEIGIAVGDGGGAGSFETDLVNHVRGGP